MTTKQQILAQLLDARDAELSGEKLAQRAGVSRAAVWKAVEALRRDGYHIEAGTNRGYRLTDAREIISAETIEELLTTQRFGRNLEVHAIIPSTNARAALLAREGAPEGTLVAARGQTEGRGRLGRRFESPADAGVYLSFVLRPQLPAAQAVSLTARCAVCVCRAIEAVADVKCEIKWVNDIWINGKKVCGILCEGETELETGYLSYAVAGIGINVAQRTFEGPLHDIATSIGNEAGKDISMNRLIAEICAQMENTGDFIDEYRSRSAVIGRTVRVTEGESIYTARVTGINGDCALILDTEDGTRLLRAGEIRVI